MTTLENKNTEKTWTLDGVSKRDIYLATDKKGVTTAYDYKIYSKMYRDGTAINYDWKIIDGYVC